MSHSSQYAFQKSKCPIRLIDVDVGISNYCIKCVAGPYKGMNHYLSLAPEGEIIGQGSDEMLITVRPFSNASNPRHPQNPSKNSSLSQSIEIVSHKEILRDIA
jgi:hypothetical protein